MNTHLKLSVEELAYYINQLNQEEKDKLLDTIKTKDQINCLIELKNSFLNQFNHARSSNSSNNKTLKDRIAESLQLLNFV